LSHGVSSRVDGRYLLTIDLMLTSVLTFTERRRVRHHSTTSYPLESLEIRWFLEVIAAI
jgi:hypothetical protein